VATGGDQQILLAVRPNLIGHGHGVAVGGKLGFRDFFSGFHIKSADERVESSADENEAAGGCYRTAKIDRSVEQACRG